MNMNDDYGLNSHFSGLEWLISKIWTAVISSADFLSPKMKNAFNCLEKQQKCLILQGSEKQWANPQKPCLNVRQTQSNRVEGLIAASWGRFR